MALSDTEAEGKGKGKSKAVVYDLADDESECLLCHATLACMTAMQKTEHYDSCCKDTSESTSGLDSTQLRPTKPLSTTKTYVSSKGKASKSSGGGMTSKFFSHGKDVVKLPKMPCSRLKAGDGQFWHPALDTPPPDNVTPGLIPLLRKALLASHANGKTRKAYLCCKDAVHFQVEYGVDLKWGCGYRNYQMACAALTVQNQQPMYSALIDGVCTPTVRNLQQLIEMCWEHGYDEEGQEQLEKVVNSDKWIGSSDLWVVFSFLGIPCNLVQFDCKASPKGFNILTDWVRNYFSDSAPQTNGSADVNSTLMGTAHVTVTKKMPIMLQHKGHSRTIVGCEEDNKGTVHLLFFNPSKSLKKFALKDSPAKSTKEPTPPKRDNPRKRGADEIIEISDSEDVKIPRLSASEQKRTRKEEDSKCSDLLSTCRESLKSFKHDLYQILYFPLTEPLTDEEKESRKCVFGENL